MMNSPGDISPNKAMSALRLCSPRLLPSNPHLHRHYLSSLSSSPFSSSLLSRSLATFKKLPRSCLGSQPVLGMEHFWTRGSLDKNKTLVEHLQQYGVLKTDKVAEVMETIDRGLFVPHGSAPYVDSPMSIGYNATISAPHMHATCLELLKDNLQPGMRALDVGSDGRFGWREEAPYDAIHVGAAASEIPQALLEQLKPGGRMVIPVGDFFQDLQVVAKKPDGSITIHTETSVRYVPLTSRSAQLQNY
ncbi:protein-L-isoaspartate O-methyltransferase-like isoform X4 [Typha latifolia]|uniref:protein-L-isoaspartate O-methyltransferase-like isoform X4 n=1 Tax=Typha latifolia TaxID=4733 RepID=UPI003C2BCA3A